MSSPLFAQDGGPADNLLHACLTDGAADTADDLLADVVELVEAEEEHAVVPAGLQVLEDLVAARDEREDAEQAQRPVVEDEALQEAGLGAEALPRLQPRCPPRTACLRSRRLAGPGRPGVRCRVRSRDVQHTTTLITSSVR